MPVYLKNFYTKQLTDTVKKEHDEVKKQTNPSSNINKLDIPTNPRFKR